MYMLWYNVHCILFLIITYGPLYNMSTLVQVITCTNDDTNIWLRMTSVSLNALMTRKCINYISNSTFLLNILAHWWVNGQPRVHSSTRAMDVKVSGRKLFAISRIHKDVRAKKLYGVWVSNCIPQTYLWEAITCPCYRNLFCNERHDFHNSTSQIFDTFTSF